MDIILNLLQSQIINTKKNRSSSYNNYLKNINYMSIWEQFGTGGFAKKKIIRDIFNFFFSRLIYKFKIFKKSNYSNICLINKKLNVSLNINMIWHLYSFEYLKKRLSPKNICIIGDGKCNSVFNAFVNFPNIRIFSINLAEVLINDYLIIKKSKIFNKNQICVITKITQNINSQKKLILIPANLKNFINKFDIDLFVCISTLQEMNEIEKNKYLKIISMQKDSYFYFCERIKKVLSSKEINLFKEYFPKNCNVLFNEKANFMKIYYDSKFPYIHIRDKNREYRHALVQIK